MLARLAKGGPLERANPCTSHRLRTMGATDPNASGCRLPVGSLKTGFLRAEPEETEPPCARPRDLAGVHEAHRTSFV